MKNSLCGVLKVKKEQILDKHFDKFFGAFLIVFYVVTIFFASFFVSQIFEFRVPENEEIAWRQTAISLNEKYKNGRVTVSVNDANVTIDNEVVYIWRGITKPTITYDFSNSEVELKTNNAWCIILGGPMFFIFMLLITLVIGGIIFLVVKTERYIFKKIAKN